jgi:hypothetical protein
MKMNYKELSEAVRAEYGEEVALYTAIITSFSLMRKATKKELLGQVNRTESIRKEAANVLWEAPKDKVEIALDVWEVIYTWQINRVLHDKVSSFRELVEENRKQLA